MNEIYEILHSGAKTVEEYKRNKLNINDLNILK